MKHFSRSLIGVAELAAALCVLLAVFSAAAVRAKSDPVTVNSHQTNLFKYSKAKRPASTNSIPTFNRDIAPILFTNCATCHRPGEAGPFPLLTYNDARKHATQIAEVTRLHIMPPWLPEPQPLKLADERRLTQAQILTLQRWVQVDTPEGKPEDLSPQPKFVAGWQLGEPDLILNATKPYTLPATGLDRYWNFILPIGVKKTRWIRAIEIRAGDRRLVHHANIIVDRLAVGRLKESESGYGFEGMDLRVESEVFDPDSHLFFWKPGSVPYREPEDLSLRVDPGTDLILNTHLQPGGKLETVQPSIGIYFGAKPATKFPMLLELESDFKLDIPPGERNFVVTDEFKLPTDVELLAIYPHAHYLGKNLLAEAVLPSGKIETLIHIPRWDQAWQAVFRYEKSLTLRKGTVVRMRYAYDNSTDNVRNPNHPPKRVQAGNQASDEMAHLWLQVLPINVDAAAGDPRRTLQEALSRHHVERNPSDFEAHYNLAAMLEARGESAAAIQHFKEALRLRPGDPVVNNALGSALMDAGNTAEAISNFHMALLSRPEYFDAHYNLGIALASQNQFAQALVEFRESVRISPNDAGAEANLGGALAQLGQLVDAKAHLQRALDIDPKSQLAQENLAAVEAMLATH